MIRKDEIVKTNIINGGETDQTPIEIMLGIDEEGKTTARKLYNYLQLDKSNFAKWCKRNITENSFAEENKDFVRLVLDDETPTGGKITKNDYKITASFAKKLCMTSQSPRGEQARNYFIKIEDILKEKSQMQTTLANKQEEDFNNKIMFVTNVLNQMATATSQYFMLMANHKDEIKKEVVDIVKDSINAKDEQINDAINLIGIRDKNTKNLVRTLKNKLSDLTGRKINATNPLYIKAKNKIFKEHKIYNWEDISTNNFNRVYSYIDSLEKEDMFLN